MEFDPWNLSKNIAGSILQSDPQLAKIKAAKKSLELYINNVNVDELSIPKNQIAKLCIDACNSDLVSISKIAKENFSLINSVDTNGLTPLIYAICFNNIEVAEFLLVNLKSDPNLTDNLISYSPIMWAVYLDHLDIVKILLNNGADPFFKNKNNKNSIDLLTPNSEMYVYFQQHNLLNHSALKNGSAADTNEVFFKSDFFPHNEEIDDFSTQIKLQTAGISDFQINDDEKSTNIEANDILQNDASFNYLSASDEIFDYDKLLNDQYIRFTDSDIPKLLEYIFGLYNSMKHKTTIPASIIYQLLRYSQLKAESKELTDFLFNLFITNIRSVTNTKSGVFNLSDSKNGDIVLISYWLSVLQFLYFYLVKDSKIINLNPHFLQEIITTINSLIAQLSFSLNNRLNLLIDDCLLNYVNIPGIDNVLFKKNWNFFKNKSNGLKNYDDVFNMLYPPSQREQMKPSPIRISQTLGALDYVLSLHNLHKVIKFQTFSQVFHWLGSTLFNRVISSKKYLSRSQAIQIRLNLSTVEDWLRSHDSKLQRPDELGGLSKSINGQLPLKNLLTTTHNDPVNNPYDLEYFYSNSFFEIGKKKISPFIELLQWLQCMTSLIDESILIETISGFQYLNYFQILKITKSYKYEVGESKLPKGLMNIIKKNTTEVGESSINQFLNYTTSTSLTSKEIFTYFNPDFIFPITLPNYQESITAFGSGLGGVNTGNLKKYQPLLPIDILDEIDDIKQLNKFNNYDDTYDDNEQRDGSDEEEDHEEEEAKEGEDGRLEETDSNRVNKKRMGNDNESNDKIFKGDEMFKQVKVPNSAVLKTWGDDDIEANPW